MLEYVIQSTMAFLEGMPKSVRKKKGQFFTSKETAQYMARMFSFDNISDEVSILDPGCGSGILTAAIVELLQTNNEIKIIELTCYETDPEILPLLRENLAYIKEHSRIELSYTVIEDDYLLSQQHDFNGSLLADSAPNLYFMFASMSLFNLKQEHEMVYIIPRSWTSGAYFKKFREYLLSEGKIIQMHLFVSRDKVFKGEEVLQETMIIKIRKSSVRPQNVLITSSNSNNDFNEITKLKVPYDSVVSGKDLYVFLPTTNEDVETISLINKYSKTLPDIGLRMRTGIVVDFRQWDELRENAGEGIVPLFYSQHIRNGRVHHKPSGKQFDWIVTDKAGLIQKNKNYVFCKRFTAKEEKRRLQCGVYLAEDFPQYEYIGTQNKINYVDSIDGTPLSKEIVFGVYVILNSTLFDKYYRILNGSTQVNSTEINSIPVPDLDDIARLGKSIMEVSDLSTEACDALLSECYQ